jgi:hypothetical protein
MCGVQEAMKTLSCTARTAKLCLTTAIVLAAFGAIQIFARTGQARGDTSKRQAYSGPTFRYVIIYNDPAVDGLGRDLHIMMDRSEFSEQNLRALYGLLCQRFQNLPGFTVYIETSLQDIDTPEERDGGGYSEVPGNPNAGKTPAATIRHSPQADSLYIYLPSRGTDHPRKIDLRVPSSS